MKNAVFKEVFELKQLIIVIHHIMIESSTDKTFLSINSLLLFFLDE